MIDIRKKIRSILIKEFKDLKGFNIEDIAGIPPEPPVEEPRGGGGGGGDKRCYFFKKRIDGSETNEKIYLTNSDLRKINKAGNEIRDLIMNSGPSDFGPRRRIRPGGSVHRWTDEFIEKLTSRSQIILDLNEKYNNHFFVMGLEASNRSPNGFIYHPSYMVYCGNLDYQEKLRNNLRIIAEQYIYFIY